MREAYKEEKTDLQKICNIIKNIFSYMKYDKVNKIIKNKNKVEYKGLYLNVASLLLILQNTI